MHELTIALPFQWYVKESNGLVVDSQPNTTLLDVALAFSIALGLAANIALIVRFLERRIYASTMM